MTNIIEYKNYGDSNYEVFIVSDYNSLTKRVSYTSLGFIKKENNKWVNKDGVQARTRKELTNKLIEMRKS